MHLKEYFNEQQSLNESLKQEFAIPTSRPKSKQTFIRRYQPAN